MSDDGPDAASAEGPVREPDGPLHAARALRRRTRRAWPRLLVGLGLLAWAGLALYGLVLGFVRANHDFGSVTYLLGVGGLCFVVGQWLVREVLWLEPATRRMTFDDDGIGFPSGERCRWSDLRAFHEGPRSVRARRLDGSTVLIATCIFEDSELAVEFLRARIGRPDPGPYRAG